MLDPATFSFLRSLARHNDRDWFEANRHRYEQAKTDAEALVGNVILRVSATDSDIAGQLPRQCLFRIYRDVRFSKNKAPYKDHFGAYMAKGGKKSTLAGYYLHLAPKASFAAAGLWMPMAGELAKVRQEIDYCYDEFKALLSARSFRKRFRGLQSNEAIQLTRMPKGYEADHPASEHLRLKSFIASCPLTDEVLTSSKAATSIADAFATLTPLVRFLNRSIED
ncbi:MAG: DUF2461 domain-containing protein [Bacteroidetes bacterium]|nr:DUF2461 domain-containing protein [Bacteroidota bacterium]